MILHWFLSHFIFFFVQFQSFEFSLRPKIIFFTFFIEVYLFIFVSNLYTQRGVWTHYPKIKSNMLLWLSQSPQLLFLIMAKQFKWIIAHSLGLCSFNVPLLQTETPETFQRRAPFLWEALRRLVTLELTRSRCRFIVYWVSPFTKHFLNCK